MKWAELQIMFVGAGDRAGDEIGIGAVLAISAVVLLVLLGLVILRARGSGGRSTDGRSRRDEAGDDDG